MFIGQIDPNNNYVLCGVVLWRYVESDFVKCGDRKYLKGLFVYWLWQLKNVDLEWLHPFTSNGELQVSLISNYSLN